MVERAIVYILICLIRIGGFRCIHLISNLKAFVSVRVAFDNYQLLNDIIINSNFIIVMVGVVLLC